MLEGNADGTARLERTRDSRRWEVVGAALMLLVWACLAFLVWRVLGVLPIVLSVYTLPELVRLVWALWGREYWRVGGDLLEIHRSLFGREWVRRYGGATLRVERFRAFSSSAPRLAIEHQGQGWLAWRRRVLCYEWGEGEGQARAIGQILAHYTGWPLRVDEGTGPSDTGKPGP
jgi:hypothetical protein